MNRFAIITLIASVLSLGQTEQGLAMKSPKGKSPLSRNQSQTSSLDDATSVLIKNATGSIRDRLNKGNRYVGKETTPIDRKAEYEALRSQVTTREHEVLLKAYETLVFNEQLTGALSQVDGIISTASFPTNRELFDDIARFYADKNSTVTWAEGELAATKRNFSEEIRSAHEGYLELKSSDERDKKKKQDTGLDLTQYESENRTDISFAVELLGEKIDDARQRLAKLRKRWLWAGDIATKNDEKSPERHQAVSTLMEETIRRVRARTENPVHGEVDLVKHFDYDNERDHLARLVGTPEHRVLFETYTTLVFNQLIEGWISDVTLLANAGLDQANRNMFVHAAMVYANGSDFVSQAGGKLVEIETKFPSSIKAARKRATSAAKSNQAETMDIAFAVDELGKTIDRLTIELQGLREKWLWAGDVATGGLSN